jgi:hypothetical protein
MDRREEAGYKAWHSPSWGRCAVCSQPGRLQRHHVVLEQHCRAQGADPWDMRNALELGMWCRCHRDHHQAARRIPVSKIPGDAVDFCTALYGPGAAAYLQRYYSAT